MSTGIADHDMNTLEVNSNNEVVVDDGDDDDDDDDFNPLTEQNNDSGSDEDDDVEDEINDDLYQELPATKLKQLHAMFSAPACKGLPSDFTACNSNERKGTEDLVRIHGTCNTPHRASIIHTYETRYGRPSSNSRHLQYTTPCIYHSYI